VVAEHADPDLPLLEIVRDGVVLARCRVRQLPFIIGSAASVHMRLKHRRIAPRHLEIRRRDGGLCAQVATDDALLRFEDEEVEGVFLVDGDLLDLGPVSIRVELPTPAVPEPEFRLDPWSAPVQEAGSEPEPEVEPESEPESSPSPSPEPRLVPVLTLGVPELGEIHVDLPVGEYSIGSGHCAFSVVADVPPVVADWLHMPDGAVYCRDRSTGTFERCEQGFELTCGPLAVQLSFVAPGRLRRLRDGLLLSVDLEAPAKRREPVSARQLQGEVDAARTALQAALSVDLNITTPETLGRHPVVAPLQTGVVDPPPPAVEQTRRRPVSPVRWEPPLPAVALVGVLLGLLVVSVLGRVFAPEAHSGVEQPAEDVRSEMPAGE
jgi:hypothetical protein